MIVYDGIIEKLQPMGGITVLFQELLLRSDENSVNYFNYVENSNIFKTEVNNFKTKSRVLERYRDFNLKVDENSIFHSTYYRVPLSKAKVITTVHDFTYEKFSHGLAKKVHVWQKHKAIMNSDHIICVSNNTATDLQHYCNVKSDIISVVYNGVSSEYTPLDLDFTENVLFVGSRGGYKNFNLAVQAISLSRKFFLNIVGMPLSVNEVKLLEDKLPNRYRFLGKLTNQELNLEYNKAYALLYPSSYEGFGIPALEAMRAGCPVIAMNGSSLSEVVGSAGLLIDSTDAYLMHEALMSIDKNRQELIRSGYIQAKKFSWDKCYNETLSVYKKFL